MMVTIKNSDLQECIANRINYNEEVTQNIRISLAQDSSRITFIQQRLKDLEKLQDVEKHMNKLESIQPIINKMGELAWADHRTALRLTDKKIMSLGGKGRNYWQIS